MDLKNQIQQLNRAIDNLTKALANKKKFISQNIDQILQIEKESYFIEESISKKNETLRIALQQQKLFDESTNQKENIAPQSQQKKRKSDESKIFIHLKKPKLEQVQNIKEIVNQLVDDVVNKIEIDEIKDALTNLEKKYSNRKLNFLKKKSS
ncbi:unnamed protein product [Brachionus calyciflorus]|uniref:Uncharacterized protein n=1 Tax=Brachionus calyciflorus TaxID=104777 RepID=A0A813YF51_9BILA|nr:unnamed protein product [Brachionus calyciflorus]